MSIYDASMLYQQAGVPLVILAGKEYGSGSSRDWAAKGTMLLGVKAVIAESFERIHRSNLVNMGVLPLEFQPGESVGEPRAHGPRGVRADRHRRRPPSPRRRRSCARSRTTARPGVFTARVRIDTPEELTAYSHGGILPYVLRQLVKKNAVGIGDQGSGQGSPDDAVATRSRRARRELGFDLCGIAPAAELPELTRLREWLDRGYAGEMVYLEKSADTRADIRRFLPTARSVIVTGTVYYTDNERTATDRQGAAPASVARYAWGEDYHLVLTERLEALVAWMREAARRAVRRRHLRRQTSRAGARVRQARRARVDRQEHLRDSSRGRFVDAARRRRGQPRAAR